MALNLLKKMYFWVRGEIHADTAGTKINLAILKELGSFSMIMENIISQNSKMVLHMESLDVFIKVELLT
jgi:hypothetical protein